MTYSPFCGELELSDGRKVFVKRATQEHGPGIKRFFETLSPESWECFQAHPFTDEVIARRMERSENFDDLVYVALAGETVAAYFFLWSINNPVPLLGIGIADAWQNCKMGQKLMTILIDDAKKLDKVGIELTTRLDNERAFHVYQKLGFQYYGDVRNEVASGEIVIERGMFLPLKEGIVRPDTKHECPE
jgi:ribosomal protein S18 acetylase RimI-like enzyme